jgi:hypothetical protein
MDTADGVEAQATGGESESPDSDLLRPLIDRRTSSVAAPLGGAGVFVGKLVGITDDGCTPLVTFGGQPGTAAQRARTIVDLHGAHIGHRVVLMFESADASKPIVMGVVRGQEGWPLPQQPETVDFDIDGKRMVVSAKDQLVLQCGKARITLTSAGKVLIEGMYVSSRSAGVNRIKGGSVEIN